MLNKKYEEYVSDIREEYSNLWDYFFLMHEAGINIVSHPVEYIELDGEVYEMNAKETLLLLSARFSKEVKDCKKLKDILSLPDKTLGRYIQNHEDYDSENDIICVDYSNESRVVGKGCSKKGEKLLCELEDRYKHNLENAKVRTRVKIKELRMKADSLEKLIQKK